MHDRRGFTIVELVAAVLSGAVVLSAALPTLQRSRQVDGIDTSLSNLTELGIAHLMYSVSWDGRQFSNTVYDLASYGANASQAFPLYQYVNGEPHPPLLLGWTDDTGGLWGYYMDHPGNWVLAQPIVFQGPANSVGFGWFRVPNAKPLHDFVNGRLYDPAYYAPNDTEVYELVEPLFDDPGSFDTSSGNADLYWSSYCLSPAALLHPDVMRHPDDGGWQDPWSIDHGFTAPGLWDATYPDLKTQLIEHNWNQNPPVPRCNPNSEHDFYEGCDPYYFNQGLASEPAALFYDLSARLLPNTEAIAADAAVMAQTGSGLWSRDTPLGADGYFGSSGYDVFSLAHHILTTQGIHGRDTVTGAASASLPPRKDRLTGAIHVHAE